MSYRRPRFPEDNFLRLPNAWARDGQLRPNAKAILMSILSHDPGWELSTAQLMRETGLGRDAIQAATRHMLERGYLEEVAQTRDGGTGKWGGNDYLVTDCVGVPSPPTVTVDPDLCGENLRIDPLRSDPATAHPVPGSPARKKTPGEKTKEIPSVSPSAEELFDAFWFAYPRKVGKDAARRAWRSAVKRADPAKIIAAVKTYPWSPNPQYVPHPQTWLNGGRWEDDPSAARPAANPDQRVTGANYGPRYQDPDPKSHPDAFRGAF